MSGGFSSGQHVETGTCRAFCPSCQTHRTCDWTFDPELPSAIWLDCVCGNGWEEQR